VSGPLKELYEGPVVDNKDPKKLGRVKVSIPGVADPTGWAFPLGWAGAGAKKLGAWQPPPIGAEVGVLFKQGEPDQPRYIGGYPGTGEAPDEVEESSVEEATQIPYLFNGKRWKFIMDERPGKARIAIEDKKTGDKYEIDGVKLGLKLKSTAAMSIECDGAVDIKGTSVTINGRRVAPNTKPI
jgi:hypothetical protein